MVICRSLCWSNVGQHGPTASCGKHEQGGDHEVHEQGHEAAAGSKLLVTEFLDMFLDYKEKAAVVELSTIRGYRHEAKLVCKYVGDVKLSDLHIAEVNEFMAGMTADGYSPKSVAECFRLLKQALKWAVAQDMLTKNPCDFCKPPKRVKTPINTLNRADRTRMLQLARAAGTQPLALAIELALTTGMRRGEICALRRPVHPGHAGIRQSPVQPAAAR